MTDETEEVARDKLRAEAERILAEAAKIRAEAADLARPRWQNPSVFIPLLLAFGTGFGGLLSAYYTVQIKRSEVAEARLAGREELITLRQGKAELEAEAAQLRASVAERTADRDRLAAEARRLSERREALEQDVVDADRRREDALRRLDEIERALAAANAAAQAQALPPAVRQGLVAAEQSAQAAAQSLERGRTTVYLQFRGDIDRDIMRALQARLAAAGYRVPGIERVAAEYGNEVRYFHPEDADAAREILGLVQQHFAGECRLRTPAAARQLRLTAPRGNIEVWIGATTGTCR